MLQVPGVGKKNGLLLNMNPVPNSVPVLYRIFISEIGTTYSKVYFDVDMSKKGEVDFDIHGLHFVQVGEHKDDIYLQIKLIWFVTSAK